MTRAHTASRPGSQDGDLGHSLGRPEAVVGQPADVRQTSQRLPRVDEVAVDFGAIASDDIAKVLFVPERESGEVEERVALRRLGPVDDAGDLIAGDEDVVDLQVAVDEDRCPGPERSFGEPAVACDHVGRKDVVGNEPLACNAEARCELVETPTGPWRQRRVVQRPDGGTRCGPRRRRCNGRLAEAPQCRPRESGQSEHRRLRQRISGVGTGAIAIASTSTSVRA